MEKPKLVFDTSMLDKSELSTYESLSSVEKEKFEKLIVSREKEKQKMEELKRKLAAQKTRVQNEKRKEDAHNKIVLGGAVLSVLGREYQPGDEQKLIAFLKSQNDRGNYFTNAMNFEKSE